MIAWLADNGVALLMGSTLVLGVGGVIVWRIKEPLHKQRVGELTVLACLLWAGLAAVPMPRWQLEEQVAPTRTTRSLPRLVDWPAADAALSPSTRPHSRPRPDTAASPRVSSAPRAEETVTPPAERLATVFLVGCAASVAWLLLGVLGLARALVGTRPAPKRALQLLRSLPGGEAVRLRVSARNTRPFCVGLRRPWIVVPAALQDLRPVLLHELAHVRQGDLRATLLFAAARPLLWFHPCYWWLRSTVRFASETVADELAAKDAGRADYARRLIELAERQVASAAPPAASLALFHSRSEFFRRMEMLIARRDGLQVRCSNRRRVAQVISAGLVVVVAAGLFGGRPLPAQEKPDVRKEIERLKKERAKLLEQIERISRRVGNLPGSTATPEEDPGGPPRPSAPNAGPPEPGEAPPGPVARPRNPLSAPGAPARGPGASGAPRRFPTPPPGPSRPAPALDPEAPPGPSRPGVPEADPGEPESPFRPARRGAPAADPTPLEEPGESVPPRGPIRNSQPSPRSAPSGRIGGLDTACFELVTSAIDLRGEIEIWELEVHRLTALAKSGAADPAEAKKARVRLQATRSKYMVARRLIEAEMEATAVEIDETKKLLATGLVPKGRTMAQLRRLEARYVTLKSGR